MDGHSCDIEGITHDHTLTHHPPHGARAGFSIRRPAEHRTMLPPTKLIVQSHRANGAIAGEF
jgi:hypothetical protein